MMAKYRKKPVVVEVVQFNGKNQLEIEAWFIGHNARDRIGLSSVGDTVYIETLEGTMHALPGDYIIRGVEGEFYPCKPDIFEQTYEPITESEE